ncbi:hypothetical protein J7I98_12930 [Streptomyces sp. ISL-98]|uniref:hypothetical protein n=1 Tax=Streptomyces sp. ISL-98 TaxID=2819192 RepID=UPI001BEB1976|nr:hypothetical protein [Streptomyces sp. ISL-98]MBT2506777.1 hypothetical protein [Streptomyces sp. ISL-98]
MRMMLRAVLDTEASNQAINNGSLQKLMVAMTEKLKPEAAYFGPSNGCRCCTFVFDMKDSSEMPAIAEPLFELLGAKFELHPVMNADDLQKGLAAAGVQPL